MCRKKAIGAFVVVQDESSQSRQSSSHREQTMATCLSMDIPTPHMMLILIKERNTMVHKRVLLASTIIVESINFVILSKTFLHLLIRIKAQIGPNYNTKGGDRMIL